MRSAADSFVQGNNTGYNTGTTGINLAMPGMNGYMPNYGVVDSQGKTVGGWISNAAYIKRNVIPVLLEYPKAFDYMPNPQTWIAALKGLMEIHPTTIDGLTSGLEVEVDEHPIGAAGQSQEEITNVKRTKGNVSYTWKDKQYKTIVKFWDTYIRWCMQDPDTKKPLIANQFGSGLSDISMYTPDFYTCSMLYIEPDITFKNVVDAWLVVNMAPKGTGDRTGKRDIANAGETVDVTIEFTGITIANNGLISFAQNILNGLSVLSKIPDSDLVLPVTGINSSVAALSSAGFSPNTTGLAK